MKISTNNIHQFIKHCESLSKLAGIDSTDRGSLHAYFEGVKIYEKLNRLERKANRIATDECNGDLSTDEANDKHEKIEKTVKKLLPNVETFFINGDPRGYSLKIKEEEAKKLQIHSDWGGYGILAPEFS